MPEGSGEAQPRTRPNAKRRQLWLEQVNTGAVEDGGSGENLREEWEPQVDLNLGVGT